MKTSRVRAGKRAPTKTTRHGNGAGWGGPATGYGWGGPARGHGSGKLRHDLGGRPGPGRRHLSIAGEQRLDRESRQSEEMLRFLYELAHDLEASSMLRIHAASKLLDYLEGPPVRRIVVRPADPLSLLTDDELQAECSRVRERLAEFDKARQTDRDESVEGGQR